MKRRKIRVFLSGTVNSTNAQNLNCLALARHLDKSKFEVRALTVYSGKLPTEKIEGVKYLPVRYPARIWHPIQLVRGILWSVMFHVVGGGVGGDGYAAQCKASGLANVVFHGSLTHDQLKAILPEVQLHVLPSRAEGFPKVIIETAGAGMPSLVYGDYGADEWITTGKDGFVVNTVDEMTAVIRDLVDHPEKMQPLADGARELARRFDAREVIKEWEVAIQQLAI